MFTFLLDNPLSSLHPSLSHLIPASSTSYFLLLFLHSFFTLILLSDSLLLFFITFFLFPSIASSFVPLSPSPFPFLSLSPSFLPSPLSPLFTYRLTLHPPPIFSRTGPPRLSVVPYLDSRRPVPIPLNISDIS